MHERPTVGLALGSGSARGWAHIGVIRVLQREGIPIDLVSGASIGAVVGAALAADSLDTLESWVRELVWADLLRFVDITLPRSGLIEGAKVIDFFREHFLDQTIEDLPVPLTIVAADLNSGEELWLSEGPVLEAVRASIAIPGIFTPVLREGHWLVDGGLVNPVPVSVCRAMGADIIIAVNLNTGMVGRSKHSRKGRRDSGRKRRRGRTKLSGKIATHLNHTWHHGKSVVFEKFGLDQKGRGPSLFEVLVASIHIMQDSITRHRLASDPPDILISPSVAQIGLLEFNRAEEAIEAGSKAAEYSLPLLQEAFS